MEKKQKTRITLKIGLFFFSYFLMLFFSLLYLPENIFESNKKENESIIKAEKKAKKKQNQNDSLRLIINALKENEIALKQKISNLKKSKKAKKQTEKKQKSNRKRNNNKSKKHS